MLHEGKEDINTITATNVAWEQIVGRGKGRREEGRLRRGGEGNGESEKGKEVKKTYGKHIHSN